MPIVVMFDKSMVHAVNDIFGMDNYEIAPDGRLKVTFHMGISGWLYGFLLGFGDKIEVLEPAELREKIKSMAENICKDYKKEYKDLYMPKDKPVLIEVPPMNFLMVDGSGDPNNNPDFQEIACCKTERTKF